MRKCMRARGNGTFDFPPPDRRDAMSSRKFCDNILVLEQGEIAEFGIRQELFDRRGRYYELYQAQARHYV